MYIIRNVINLISINVCNLRSLNASVVNVEQFYCVRDTYVINDVTTLNKI